MKTTTKKSRCECGKVKSRFANHCKACDESRRAKRVAEAVEVVRSGKCPHCGAGLRRNNSMSGWWQCEQFGAEGFRKDDNKPSCNFQTFTE